MVDGYTARWRTISKFYIAFVEKIGVEVNLPPGLIKLLRIPHGASKCASILPRCIAPALLAPYASPEVIRRLSPEMLATVIIWLLLWSSSAIPISLRPPFSRRRARSAGIFPPSHPRLLLPVSSSFKNAAETKPIALVLMAKVDPQPSGSASKTDCSSSIVSAVFAGVSSGP